MTEQVKFQSKYAAKKAARVETAKVETISIPSEASEAASETKVERKPFKKQFGLPPITEKFPEHVVQLALLIKNNAEIRRFTALGVLNYLLQKGEINGEKRYVSFKWNKFAVKANGLMREYSYNEPFFLNCLVAAFSSFSASAQRTIDAFCKKEMSTSITKCVDQNEVANITVLNEQYQSQDVEVEAE